MTTANKSSRRTRIQPEIKVEVRWTVVDKLPPAQQEAWDKFWDSIIGIKLYRPIHHIPNTEK